jgi:hypothetical protein
MTQQQQQGGVAAASAQLGVVAVAVGARKNPAETFIRLPSEH